MVRRVTKIDSLTGDEIQQISLFKERAEDLRISQSKYQNIPMSSHSRDQNGKGVSFQGNTPDIDHVVNLAIKFRFFYAEQEPTQFEKVSNLLAKKAEDEWARNYINRIKLWYKDAMKSADTTGALGHPISNREIISLWFNSHFFHSDLDKRGKLDCINQVVGKKASLFQLYITIVRCSSHIKSLYDVVHRLSDADKVLCTPNHHFRLDRDK
jgi:hypothetical protein